MNSSYLLHLQHQHQEFDKNKKMFAKFHPFDTNCFHILNSAKTTPNIAISVKPVKKHSNHQQEQRKQSPLSRGNGFIRAPDGKTVNKSTFRVKYRPRNGNSSTSQKPPIPKINEKMDFSDTLLGFEQNPDGNVGEEMEKFGNNGHNGAVQKLPLRKINGKKDFSDIQMGFKQSRDGKNENMKKNVGEKSERRVNGGVVRKLQSKCSTKWGRYGGCIPAILEALESGNDLDTAFKPWEKELSNKERSIILKEQVNWKRAVEIFEWFKRKGCCEVNVIHYNIMLRILGKAERWKEVEGLWDEMREKEIKAINSTYGTLIDVFSKGGRREDAMKWLGLMNEQGMQPDEVTMGIIVQMYKKAGEFKKAEEFFKKWSLEKGVLEQPGDGGLRSRKGVNGDSGLNGCLSSYTYNNLIDTYGKAGQVNEARKTFESMLREGIVPTTVTFNTMIHMCGNNGRLEEVGRLMQKMKELRCLPDTRTYNILISLHIKHDDIKTAAIYFKEMKAASLKPDIVSYRTLLYAYSLRLMVGEAEELVSEMDEMGLDIDEFTQSALTRMYIEAGMLEKSWSWFERFHLAGNMTSDCYSANIDAYGERGHVWEAEKVFNCCRERRKLNVLEFNVMIKAYGISKKFVEACRLFDSMEKHGVLPDKCTFSSLIQMLAGADLPEKARSYVRKMQEAGLVDDCIPYCAVISGFVKLGQLEMAAGLYKEMIGSGVKPDVVVYGVLINAYADIGSVKEATSYLEAMEIAGLKMNAVIYNSLIKLYTKVGYLKEAQDAYRILQSLEGGPDVFSSNCMIDLYSERSMVKQAEEIFGNLRRKGNANEFSYAMMLCMYKRNGRFVEAVQIARKMRELGLLCDILSYNNVLSLYATDGRYKEAAATFKEMLKSAIQPDDSTFKSLGAVLMKCGLPRESVDVLELLRKEDAQSGLRAWTSTLRSVIDMDDDNDVEQHGA